MERVGAVEPDTNDAALDISFSVMRALERLSPLERAALFLHDLYDVPFEEALTICLLDPRDRLVERVTLGGPYTTGHLHDLRIEGPDRLLFRFFGGAPYRLVIAPRPRWRVPILSDPPGARRLLFRRRLLLGR